MQPQPRLVVALMPRASHSSRGVHLVEEAVAPLARAEVDEHVVELQLVDPQALEASGPEAWSASASSATRPGSWECLGERL